MAAAVADLPTVPLADLLESWPFSTRSSSSLVLRGGSQREPALNIIKGCVDQFSVSSPWATGGSGQWAGGLAGEKQRGAAKTQAAAVVSVSHLQDGEQLPPIVDVVCVGVVDQKAILRKEEGGRSSTPAG